MFYRLLSKHRFKNRGLYGDVSARIFLQMIIKQCNNVHWGVRSIMLSMVFTTTPFTINILMMTKLTPSIIMLPVVRQ